MNHLKCPVKQRKAIRTTNLLERTLEEQKRKTKIIPRFFDEKSCLKLVYSTLIRVSQRWQRIRITSFELAQIDKLRKELGLLSPKKEEKSSRSNKKDRKAA